FLLGLTLPLLSGGNDLFSLYPEGAMPVYSLLTIVVCGRLIASREPSDPPPPANSATGWLLVLAILWASALVLRLPTPRAFLEAQGIFCAALSFAAFSSR